MATCRVEKKKDYTVMSNHHLRNKNLSLKARGLLSIVLSLPEEWDYSINGLVAICKEGQDAVRNTIKELEDNGYLVRNRSRDPYTQQFHYEYVFYEEPYSVFQHTALGHAENPTQLNTNKLNTNNQDKIDKSKTPLVWELVRRDYINEYDIDIDRYNDLFNELLETYDFVQIKIALCYIVKHWKNNNKLDNDDKPIEDKFNYFKESIINNLTKLNEVIDLDYE